MRWSPIKVVLTTMTISLFTARAQRSFDWIQKGMVLMAGVEDVAPSIPSTTTTTTTELVEVPKDLSDEALKELAIPVDELVGDKGVVAEDTKSCYICSACLSAVNKVKGYGSCTDVCMKCPKEDEKGRKTEGKPSKPLTVYVGKGGTRKVRKQLVGPPGTVFVVTPDNTHEFYHYELPPGPSQGDTYTICNDADPYIRPVADDPMIYADGAPLRKATFIQKGECTVYIWADGWSAFPAARPMVFANFMAGVNSLQGKEVKSLRGGVSSSTTD